MNKNLIAPCGMNCGVCRAYLREKDKCPGCNGKTTLKSCINCKIKLCKKRKGDFCDCDEFPCDRLKNLDKRYREKYGMSEIENLKYIKENGIGKFLSQQKEKYVSDKGTFCIHDKKIYNK